MKRIDVLTPEQEKIMIETRDEWISLALKKNTTGIDRPLFEEGINWLYTDMLNKPKPRIVYCDSWITCVLTIAVLKELSKKDKALFAGDTVRDTVRDTVGDTVRDTVWDTVGDTVRDTVRDTVWDTVRDTVRDTVWDTVGDTVRATVWDTVRATVGDTFSEYSGYIGWSDFGWVSFYDFFEKVNHLDNFNFKQYKKIIKSNVFNAYEYENFVFAIEPPITIKKNDNDRLHCVTGPAIEFKDGSHYYYINGRDMPERIFNKAITREDFIAEESEDVKAGMYEIIEAKGEGSMLVFLGAKEIDRQTFVHANGEMEEMILYRTDDKFSGEEDLNGNTPAALSWLKMSCASTGQAYLIPSDASFDNCVEAAKYHRPSPVPSDLEYSWNSRS